MAKIIPVGLGACRPRLVWLCGSGIPGRAYPGGLSMRPGEKLHQRDYAAHPAAEIAQSIESCMTVAERDLEGKLALHFRLRVRTCNADLPPGDVIAVCERLPGGDVHKESIRGVLQRCEQPRPLARGGIRRASPVQPTRRAQDSAAAATAGTAGTGGGRAQTRSADLLQVSILCATSRGRAASGSVGGRAAWRTDRRGSPSAAYGCMPAICSTTSGAIPLTPAFHLPMSRSETGSRTNIGNCVEPVGFLPLARTSCQARWSRADRRL